MKRRGFTLIETLTAVFIVGVLGSLLVVAVGKIQLAAKSSSSRHDVDRTVWQLGQQFREDVHRAKSASIGTNLNDPLLVLKAPAESTIEYIHTLGRVVRKESRGSAVESRSDWRLPRGCTTEVAFEPGSHRLLALSVKQSSEQKDAKRRETRVLADLGFDHRFDVSAAP